MKYIRNIWWDGLWIGGGLWIGLLLMCAAFLLPAGRATPFGPARWPLAFVGGDPAAHGIVCFFLLAIMLDTAHNLSPMVLTWTHPELRRVALVKWRKYILFPVIILGAACAIGAATSFGLTAFVPGPGQMYRLTLDWHNPFPWLALTYVGWEVYHFGCQNFGVVAIYRRKLGHPGNRTIDKSLCLLLTGAVMIPPLLVLFEVPGMGWFHLPLWTIFLLVGVISTTHWLVALGLGLRVTQIRWWWWLPLLLALGCIGFAWTVASPHGTHLRPIAWILSFRFGLGFVHFWYDGLIWKRGTPAMRAILA